jgi:hypothetical protein
VKRYKLIRANGMTYPSPVPGILGGHRATRIYGRLDCPSALRAIERGGYVMHRVFFADEHTPVAAGYRPCARCLPDRYHAWKARLAPPQNHHVVDPRAHPTIGSCGLPLNGLDTDTVPFTVVEIQ